MERTKEHRGDREPDGASNGERDGAPNRDAYGDANDARLTRFRRLVAPVHEQAQAFARCLCRSHADGDDVFQEALVRALQKLDQLLDDRAFKSWLYRIVISVQRSRYRRDFWRRFLPLPERDRSRSLARAADEALGGAQRVRRALAMLPAEQRETIVLFDLEDWKIDEIAALHEVSPSAVKSRLARGRARLRAIYVNKFGVSASEPAEDGHAPLALPSSLPEAALTPSLSLPKEAP